MAFSKSAAFCKCSSTAPQPQRPIFVTSLEKPGSKVTVKTSIGRFKINFFFNNKWFIKCIVYFYIKYYNVIYFWYYNTSCLLAKYITNNKIIPTGKIIFDHKTRRPLDKTLANSYCSDSYNGCNAYCSDNNLLSGSYNSLVVDSDSLMRLYLENIYYQYALTVSAKEHLTNHKIDIGLVETNKTALATVEAEKSI